MRPHIVQLTTTNTFASAAQGQITVGPQSFWVTGIGFGFETAYTVSTATAAQDWLARQVTALSVASGKHNYLSMSFRDLRGAYWSTRMVTQGRYKMSDYINANHTVDWNLPIFFHPYALNPDGRLDPTGIRAALAGKRMAGIEPDSTLNINLTWASSTSPMGTTGITQGTGSKLRVTLFGIEFDEVADAAFMPKFYPKFTLTSATPDQTYGTLGWRVKVPTGDFLEHTTAITLLGATSSSGDVRDSGYGSTSISEIGIKTSDDRAPLNVKTYDYQHLFQPNTPVADDNGDLGAGSASLAGAASVITPGSAANMGVYPIKWVDFADTKKLGIGAKVDPDFGMDLRSAADNAVNIVETVDTTTNVVQALFHRKYAPY